MNQKQKIALIAGALVLSLVAFQQDGRKPHPKPVVPSEISVLIVEETEDRPRLPADQLAVMFDQSIRDYLDKHCDKRGDVAEFRLFDDDVDLGNETEKWREVMARQRDSLPWIVISNGKQGTEGPLPENVDDTLKLLKKWGGE